MNIILTNIAPPVFPEIQVSPNSDKTKAIVIIRIPQSHETPHAITDNTQVYLRTGNRNNPEALAKIGEIQWLVNQRNQSTDLREQLQRDADVRFKNSYVNNLKQLKKEYSEVEPNKQGWFTLSLCPVYPKDVFCAPPDLNQIVGNIMVRDFYRTSSEFPITRHRLGTIFQNGIVLDYFDNDMVFYTELNILGLYFYRQILQWNYVPSGEETIKIIRATELFTRLDEFIDSGIRFYRELGYSGPLRFNMSLQNILDYALGAYPQEQLLYSVDNEIHYSRTMLTGELEDQSFDIVFDSFRQVAWAYNWNPSPEIPRGYFARHKR